MVIGKNFQIRFRYLIQIEENMQQGYRIVEIKNGKVMSLFHGTNGSREIPLNTWVKADLKEVKDGRGSFTYESGFHFLPTREEAENFFNSKFRIKDNRRIVPCLVRGRIRIKHNNKNGRNSWLADEIYIDSSLL